MLVMSRQRNEVIDIMLPGGNMVSICVVDIRGDKVRLGIAAPPEIPVHRREVREAIERQGKPMLSGMDYRRKPDDEDPVKVRIAE